MTNQKSEIAPLARKEDLIRQELGEDLLVYDRRRHRAHCLNLTAAMIWDMCNGERSASEIARLVEEHLGTPVKEEVVGLALQQLGQRRLLEGAVPVSGGLKSQARRDLLRKAAVAGLLVPVITSILAPEAAAQASCLPKGQMCSLTTAQCCPGLACDPVLNTCGVPTSGVGLSRPERRSSTTEKLSRP